MGNTQPTAGLVYHNLNNFTLCFYANDRLRLLVAPDDVVEQTTSLITSLWEIQKLDRLQGFAEYKLKGFPLIRNDSIGPSSSTRFKYLLCNLIRTYYRMGWHIKGTPVLQRYGTFGTSIIFERQEPIDTSIICFSLCSTDKIRFLGPENLTSSLRQTILSNWHNGIQREGKVEDSWEFKLKGNPWANTSNYEANVAPALIVELIKCLAQFNWTFCACILSGENNTGYYFRYNQFERPNMYDYFGITLSGSDKIRLIRPVPNLIELVRATITQSWLFGIQNQTGNETFYEFKLNGNPWSCTGEEAVFCRQLMNRLIGNLMANNCELYAPCTFAERVSTFIFRKSVDQKLNPLAVSSKIMSISLNSIDKVRIINEGPNLSDIVRNSIAQGWPLGIQEERVYGVSYEFKLKGHPFAETFTDPIDVCALIMCLISNFKYSNIAFIGSGDLSATSDTDNTYYQDIHTLFFQIN